VYLQALMRKVFNSVNSGDGVAAARGKQARLDIMVRACTASLLVSSLAPPLPASLALSRSRTDA
jgi:hypothetical protein